MPLEIDLGARLREKLLTKATELGHSSSLKTEEWAKKFLPHYFFRGMCELHHKLAAVGDELQADRQGESSGGKRILVIAPRGNAKSTWCSLAIPLKAICEGTEKYIIMVADTAGQAESYLANIAAELEGNDLLREAYPLACQQATVWNASRKETKNGVCIEAVGKGSKVRGRRFGQYRPSLFIVDDPQSDEDVLSANTRAKDVDWFDKALCPAGDTETNILVVGTMLHRECIVGILGNRPSFEVVRFASIMQWPDTLDTLWKQWANLYHSDTDKCKEFYTTNSEAMQVGAKVLWPEKEDLYTLMVMREDIGHLAFASEKQNDPRDPSKCEFPEEWFDGCMYTEPPKYNKIVTVGFLDPAMGGQTKKHDYPAIIILHYLPEYGYCLVEVDMRKRPVSTRIDDIIALHGIVHFSVFGVESVGFQQLIGAELTAKAPLLPISLVENTGTHKNTRISRLGIWLQRKFFRFKSGCPDTKILLNQLKDHPHSDHDDGPDALEGALRILTQYVDLGVTDINGEDLELDDGLGNNIFGNTEQDEREWVILS